LACEAFCLQGVGDELRSAVDLDVVLVAVEVHLVLFGPAGVTVFLAELVGLGLPGFRSLSLLDLLVLVTVVALAGHFDEVGIDNLAGVGKEPLRVKGFV